MYSDKHIMTEGRIKNQRFKEFYFSIAELSINIHGHFISNFLAFNESIGALLSEEVTNPFNNSILMANYTKMLNIFNFIDE